MSKPPARRRFKWLLPLALCGVLVGAGYGWYRYTFPYGRSHCCLKQLGLALRNYADMNNGCYPAGEKCPEASLSLLYRCSDLSGALLCGKTKSAAQAEQILARGGLLDGSTCDWHYVEGLTSSDDPQLALVWDKVGLGHNGQRLPQGGHSVWRLGGSEEVIPDSQWQAFLAAQARLVANRPRLVSGTVTLDGQPVEGATIQFVPSDGGKPVVGQTNADGTYELGAGAGARPGSYRVKIKQK